MREVISKVTCVLRSKKNSRIKWDICIKFGCICEPYPEILLGESW